MNAESNDGRGPENAGQDKSLESPASGAKSESEWAKEARWLHEHGDEYGKKLLENIKAQLPRLEELLAEADGHWGLEDHFYRFYHQSFKVYYLQRSTDRIHRALAALLPDRPVNAWFLEIVKQGTGHQFDLSHNQDWTRHTRPILEAFFHAYFFLKMACKYGKELEAPPSAMPSGWAAVLYLFDLR